VYGAQKQNAYNPNECDHSRDLAKGGSVQCVTIYGGGGGGGGG